MAEVARKRCTVAFATPARQYEWSVELAADATIAAALERVRSDTDVSDVPWETCDVGIFGQLCDRSAVPRDGDRIELYRPLARDPKEARRERARNRSGR